MSPSVSGPGCEVQHGGSDYEVVTSCRNSCHPASEWIRSPDARRRSAPTRVPAPPPAPACTCPARTVLLGGLLLVLAVGCAVALRVRPGSESARHRGGRGTARRRRRPRGRRPRCRRSGRSPRRWATQPDARRSRPLAPQLLCPIPSGTRHVHAGHRPRVAYRAAAGADDGVAERGDAACARGHDDERAWSRPDTPTQVAGRYRCRVATARAEMWWTVDDAGVLAHATRADGDLAALFSWWRAHAEHP